MQYGPRKPKGGNLTEAVNQDVPPEFVTPTHSEDVSIAQENHDGYEDAHSLDQTRRDDDDKAMNFKAIRESNARLQQEIERERQEKQAYLERLARLEDAMQSRSTPPTQEEIDELADIAKDDWTTREAAEKLAERIAEKKYRQFREEDEKKRLEMERKRQLQELPNKIKSEHPDFDNVVTKENVEYLKANKPHIAASLAATQDPYAQAKAAYDAIKAFCPNAQVYEEQQRMEKNASKPGSLEAAKGTSPLAEAKMFERGLTPELKKKLQQEMIAATRGC